MTALEELAELLPEGWELDDTYGLDFTLVCPCGHQIRAGRLSALPGTSHRCVSSA